MEKHYQLSIQIRYILYLISGSFDGWNVLLLLDRTRIDGFTRVLKAGHANVFLEKDSNIDWSIITHCLSEKEILDRNQTVTRLIATHKIQVIEPAFISDYLFSST